MALIYTLCLAVLYLTKRTLAGSKTASLSSLFSSRARYSTVPSREPFRPYIQLHWSARLAVCTYSMCLWTFIIRKSNSAWVLVCGVCGVCVGGWCSGPPTRPVVWSPPSLINYLAHSRHRPLSSPNLVNVFGPLMVGCLAKLHPTAVAPTSFLVN